MGAPFQYFCKYSPLELLESFGYEPHLLDATVTHPQTAETLTHPNLCNHAKTLLETARNDEPLLLTTCCDSVQRVFDVLSSSTHPFNAPLYLLDIPHDDRNCAIETLTQELLSLCTQLETATSAPFDAQRFWKACQKEAALAEQQATSTTRGNYIALLGARISHELLEFITTTLRDAGITCKIKDYTCAGNRRLEHPLPNELPNQKEACMRWYAGALLSQIPCMRMTNVSRRRELTEDSNLIGVIYNTVKFCDFYGFDYIRLMEVANVPVLNIESDYLNDCTGQLHTRLEAFAETLSSSGLHKNEQNVVAHSLFAGIDSGSTSTNMVVVDQDGNIVATALVRTGPYAAGGAQTALLRVLETLEQQGLLTQLDQASQALLKQVLHLPEEATEERLKQLCNAIFASICATGYGRLAIPFATSTTTEITCHACGAHAVFPEARSIIDIGGQDSKVIELDANGNVANFVMNDKCAAGTGRFLESMARTLNLSLEELAQMGRTWDENLSISSMCTVFAESEVVSLVAQNHKLPNIVHALNTSVATKTVSLVKRAKARGPFVMDGGVARNTGVVKALESALGETFSVWDEPDLLGALGAALIARNATL